MFALLPSLFSSLLPVLAGLAIVGALAWLAFMIRKSQMAEARGEEIRQIKKINDNEDKFNAETQKRKAESAGADNDHNRGFWK